MREEIGVDMVKRVKHFLAERLKMAGVVIHTSTTVCEILSDGVIANRRGEQQQFSGFDNVVIALGTKSETSLTGEISRKFNVVVVGDAEKPADALYALYQARGLGTKI